jgi:hypothetical protein
MNIAQLDAVFDRVESLEFAALLTGASSLWALLDAIDQTPEITILAECLSDAESLDILRIRVKRLIGKVAGEENVEYTSNFDIALTFYLRLLARLAPNAALEISQTLVDRPTLADSMRYAIALQRVLGKPAQSVYISIPERAVSRTRTVASTLWMRSQAKTSRALQRNAGLEHVTQIRSSAVAVGSSMLTVVRMKRAG